MNKIISHRGNLGGYSPETKNTIVQINYALSLGFDVEIDVWSFPEADQFFLGHHSYNPEQVVGLKFLEDSRLWVHCKNSFAYEKLKDNPNVNCFEHTDEDFVLTSKGFVWYHSRVFPSPYIHPNDINQVYTYFVDKVFKDEMYDKFFLERFNICTDYALSYLKRHDIPSLK